MRVLLPFCLLLLIGCSSTETLVTTAAYDAGRSARAAVPVDSVVVFGPLDEVPLVYRRFGELVSQDEMSDGAAADVRRALRLKAAAVGAEAVQVTEEGPVDLSRGSVPVNPTTGLPSLNQGVRYRIEAIAYHRTDRGYQPPDSVLVGD